MWEELLAEGGDRAKLVEAIEQHGVPDHLRGQIYARLLDVKAEEWTRTDSLPEPSEPIPNKRVIDFDCIRTRGSNPFFQEPTTQTNLFHILVLYCEQHACEYKQGLNDVLAPLLVLPDTPVRVVYAMLSNLIARLLPLAFKDSNLQSLKCTLRLLRLMVAYHGPQVGRCLDQHNVMPELYGVPWFLTLFAYTHDLPIVYALWDAYLVHVDSNPLLHFFVAVALILEHADALRELNNDTFPVILKQLRITSVDHARSLVARAHQLVAATPISFCGRLRRFAFADEAELEGELALLDSLVCLPISAEEALNGRLVLTTTDPTPIPFTLVDCRPRELYATFHPQNAIHADPACLLDVPQLNAVIESLLPHKGKPICLYSSAGDSILIRTHHEPATPQHDATGLSNQTLMMFALHLLQLNFEYVASVMGGANALKEQMGELDETVKDDVAWASREILQFPGRQETESAHNERKWSSKKWMSKVNMLKETVKTMVQTAQLSARDKTPDAAPPPSEDSEAAQRKTWDSFGAILEYVRQSSAEPRAPTPHATETHEVIDSAPETTEPVAEKPPTTAGTLVPHDMSLIAQEELDWAHSLSNLKRNSLVTLPSLTQSFTRLFPCTQPSEYPPYAHISRTLVISSLAIAVFEPVRRVDASAEVLKCSPSSQSAAEESREETVLRCVAFWYLGMLTKVSTYRSDPSRLTFKFQVDDKLVGLSVLIGEGTQQCQQVVMDLFGRVYRGR